MQVLDGQVVSDSDRSSATDYASKQTEITVTLQASSTLAGSHGLPGSLPSSSQPGGKLRKGQCLAIIHFDCSHICGFVHDPFFSVGQSTKDTGLRQI